MMKLTEEIKKKIDSYFGNISPEELYYIAVDKYGFKENIEIEINNQSFEVVVQNFYSSTIDNSIDVNMPNDTLPLAA